MRTYTRATGTKVTGWLTAAAALMLAAMPVRADDAEVPYRQLMATAKAHAVIAAFDETSFASAIAAYPASAKGGAIALRPGRYLMWKLIRLFASDRRVDRVRLTRFQEVCTPRPGQFSTSVVCDLLIHVTVEWDGKRYTADATTENIARYIRPEPGKDRAVIYSIVTRPIDGAVRSIARDWRLAGIIAAR
jgi:hypothetical protein